MEKVSLKAKKIDSMVELSKLLKNAEFKEYIDKLNIPYETLAKYTTILESTFKEYQNCKTCKSILECQNQVDGYLYVPQNNQGIDFCYKKCRYKEALDKKMAYLKNVYTFNVPEIIKEANMKDIYKDDKKRFKVIKYISEFIDKYLEGKSVKGLYLSGKFGAGKTYLISAMFNELAKKDIKSAIIFWPEYLRMLKTLFNDNNEFKNNFDVIKEAPLLLIDDLGAENMTSWSRDEILCPILQYRMDNNLPTFITSNLSLEELERHLGGEQEPIKARRIIERIKQLTNAEELDSANLRK